MEELRRVAAERGWAVIEEIRERLSGTRADRPGLRRILELAKAGRMDVLLTWELSRLTRGGIGDLFDIVRALDAAKVKIASVQEPWASTDGPTRDLLLAVLGWAARVEHDLLVERTKSGLAHAKAIGKSVGRPRVLTGELLFRIRELRDTPGPDGKRRTWGTIAQIVHHRAGSVKKWYSASRRDSPCVINPPAEFSLTPSDKSITSRGRTVPFVTPGGKALVR